MPQCSSGRQGAVINDLGYLLACHGISMHSSHRRIVPYIGRARTHARAGSSDLAERQAPQLLRRLAIRAWGSENGQRRMIEELPDTSQLYHNPSWFNPQHWVRNPEKTIHVLNCGVRGPGLSQTLTPRWTNLFYLYLNSFMYQNAHVAYYDVLKRRFCISIFQCLGAPPQLRKIATATSRGKRGFQGERGDA